MSDCPLYLTLLKLANRRVLKFQAMKFLPLLLPSPPFAWISDHLLLRIMPSAPPLNATSVNLSLSYRDVVSFISSSMGAVYLGVVIASAWVNPIKKLLIDTDPQVGFGVVIWIWLLYLPLAYIGDSACVVQVLVYWRRYPNDKYLKGIVRGYFPSSMSISWRF